MPANDVPAAEVDIDESLVRALLRDQLPHFADRALRVAAAGWDNVIFRLGPDLLVRLPRRAASAQLIEHEQQWLPVLAPQLPLAVPVPVGIGRPGRGYPWSWSVCPWLDGDTAAAVPPTHLPAAATSLGEFLTALHQPAPAEAPVNPVRGVPLRDRDARVREQAVQMADAIDVTAVLALWDELVATPPWPEPPRWLHGDLRPANLLVRDGRVAAVIDFGDITGGDPATDLAIAWMLFDRDARAVFRAAVGADDDTWARGRGWALALGVAFVASSADDPVLASEGHAVIAAALASA